MSRWSLRILAAAVLLSLGVALAAAPVAQAVEFTQDGVVPAGAVVDDDLFISADHTLIDGTVNGDLFINASTAEVNGTIHGNLMVYSAALILKGKVTGSLVFAGQAAEISGQVDGTVYAASNTLRLADSGQVARNIFYAGYALQTRPGSTIGRDLYMTGYQAEINGQAVRDLALAVKAVKIGGQVERNANLEVSAPGGNDPFIEWLNRSLPRLAEIEPIPILPAGLTIGPQAKINGQLSYASPVQQAEAIQSQPAGGVTFTQKAAETAVQPTREEIVMAWLTSRFQELATLLILGGLAAALFPALLVRVAAQAGWRPHINAWKGFLALVLGFGVAIIALLAILILGILASVVSLGGLSNAVFGIGLSGLATAFGIFLFAINFGSKLVVAQMGGQALLQRFSPATAEHRYWPVMIGVLAYMLLRLIPLVSPLVGLTVTLVGLGAIWLVLLDKRTSEPSGVVISQ